MKFKHTFHVFVDNFSVTFKQLSYRLVILVVALGISWGCLTPFIKEFINSEALNSLLSGVQNFVSQLLKGNVSELPTISESVALAYEQLLHLLNTRITEIVLMGLMMLALIIVEKWFTGLGNYTTAAIINDKMALRKTSPFLRTLISNFKEAALYNLIYVPLSVLYDVLIAALALVSLFYMMHGIAYFFVILFLYTLIMLLAIAVKMTFTCDWLPALIRGKMGQKRSIAYTFSRKGKRTTEVFSTFIILELIILALNVMAFVFTFGVGLLVTLPASFVILICYEMVNYYDDRDLKFFLDKFTIIKPEKERVVTREQFFRGEDPDDEQ